MYPAFDFSFARAFGIMQTISLKINCKPNYVYTHISNKLLQFQEFNLNSMVTVTAYTIQELCSTLNLIIAEKATQNHYNDLVKIEYLIISDHQSF